MTCQPSLCEPILSGDSVGYRLNLRIYSPVSSAHHSGALSHIQKTAKRDDIIELARGDVAERGEWLRMQQHPHKHPSKRIAFGSRYEIDFFRLNLNR